MLNVVIIGLMYCSLLFVISFMLNSFRCREMVLPDGESQLEARIVGWGNFPSWSKSNVFKLPQTIEQKGCARRIDVKNKTTNRSQQK